MSTAIFRRIFLPRATTISVSPFCSSAVSTAVSILTHHRSKSRWSTLHTLFPNNFSPLETSQILLKIRNNPHLALRFFLHFHTRHSLQSYATIIHLCARGRLKTRAKSLIKSAFTLFDLNDPHNSQSLLLTAKRCKLFKALVDNYRVCDSAPFVFDLLIESLLEMNKLDLCIDIVRMLHRRGVCINARVCVDLISAASKNKGCFFGYELYREVFKRDGGKLVPNVHVYNELMVSFYRNGLVDMVEEVWIEMVRMKCEPNSYSYSVLMECYCGEGGGIEKAEKVWEEMRVKGLNPDIVGYNTLIGGYCRMGEVGKGEEVYREMGLRGVEGSCVTYEHLIEGYCLAGDADSAMLVYNDMCRKGFCPESLTVDSFVRVICCKKSVLDGLEFFRSAMKNADFVARESSYELLVKGLCDEGMTKDALKLQAQMAGKGFKPNSHIYGAFIDGHLKLGNTDEAESLRKEMMDM